MAEQHLQQDDARLHDELTALMAKAELTEAEKDVLSHAAERLEELSDEFTMDGGEDSESEYELGTGLERAHELVTADRNDTHGDPYENHQQISDLWTAYLQFKLPEGVEIKAHEAAIMVQQIKQSRMQAGRPIGDHFDDIAGYSEVAKYSAVQDDTVDIELED